MAIPPGLHADPLDQLTLTRDKHKAPSSTPPNPLSLQDGLRLLLHSVGNIHEGWTLLVVRHCHVHLNLALTTKTGHVVGGAPTGYDRCRLLNFIIVHGEAA